MPSISPSPGTQAGAGPYRRCKSWDQSSFKLQDIPPRKRYDSYSTGLNTIPLKLPMIAEQPIPPKNEINNDNKTEKITFKNKFEEPEYEILKFSGELIPVPSVNAENIQRPQQPVVGVVEKLPLHSPVVNNNKAEIPLEEKPKRTEKVTYFRRGFQTEVVRTPTFQGNISLTESGNGADTAVNVSILSKSDRPPLNTMLLSESAKDPLSISLPDLHVTKPFTPVRLYKSNDVSISRTKSLSQLAPPNPSKSVPFTYTQVISTPQAFNPSGGAFTPFVGKSKSTTNMFLNLTPEERANRDFGKSKSLSDVLSVKNTTSKRNIK